MSNQTQPRGLRLREAARYVGLSPAGFRAAVARGVFPGPLPGTALYDAKAIDLTMDRLSGIETTAATISAPPPAISTLSPYDEWKASQHEN